MHTAISFGGYLIYLMAIALPLLLKCSKRTEPVKGKKPGTSEENALKTSSSTSLAKSSKSNTNVASKLAASSPSSSSTSKTSRRSGAKTDAEKKGSFFGFNIRKDKERDDIKTDLRSLEEENPFSKPKPKKTKVKEVSRIDPTVESRVSTLRQPQKTVVVESKVSTIRQPQKTIIQIVEQEIQAPYEKQIMRSQYASAR
ncbi:hypothetical protein Y032_0099g3153 [Ancylostoma ceylanicum]|uniref:Uncharacterized protein n=1 Tax=Ancylostoma ceylanicum TaxID=53326 RepID=A0A016TIK3_9BILA|nr:hypothetical protein Y032_0099g3153 [Ancylostoma ceylanicum]